MVAVEDGGLVMGWRTRQAYLRGLDRGAGAETGRAGRRLSGPESRLILPAVAQNSLGIVILIPQLIAHINWDISSSIDTVRFRGPPGGRRRRRYRCRFDSQSTPAATQIHVAEPPNPVPPLTA